MKIRTLVIWIVLLPVALMLVVTGLVTSLQEPIPGTGAARDDRIHDNRYTEPAGYLGEQLESYRMSLVSPSISVAVGVRGDLVWSAARGYADIETKTAATTDTIYAVGSVSKPITAALAALLWQQDSLDIDVDVRSYVPQFPAKENPFTLRQLLSHQAGIRHYRFRLGLPTFSESDLNIEFSNTIQSLSLFEDDALLFEPDTGFNYSTFGYTLVSAAIEEATGGQYDDVLEELVLAPLGMTSTTIDDIGRIRGARATDYVATFSKKAVIQPPATNSSYKWAGGGLVSTPADLVRFGNALLGDALLNEATRNTVFTARTLPGGEPNPQHYGLGWRIGGLALTDESTGEETIIPLWHHAGTRAGSTAVLMIVPDHQIVVAMSANTVGRGASGPLTSVAAKVARRFIRFEATRDSSSE